MWAYTKKIRRKIKENRGATAIVVAVALLVLIGFLALAVDVGYIYGVRNELQNIADAGALAGAGRLGSIYLTMTYQQQLNYNCEDDIETIKKYVEDATNKNKAAGEFYKIDFNDIKIGQWDFKSKQFIETNIQPDAVMVTARRDQANKVSTFFGKVLGVNEFSGLKVAIAALSGPSKVAEGELKVPIGLSMNNFPNSCKDLIELNPTRTSCSGWHNFFDPDNASEMGQKSLNLIAGHAEGPSWLDQYFDINKTPSGTETPEVESGDQFDFNGGNVSSLFLGGRIVWSGDHNNIFAGTEGNIKQPAPFIALFDFFRMRDGDGEDKVWTATIPVYKDGDSCANPNGLTEIVGFAKIEIIMPCPPPGTADCPSSTVRVRVDCNMSVVEGRGGGGQYGNLKGSIPGLVK
jgi:hypothetical protein